ncbi:MAG: glycosyl hydrolase 53 family protein [Chitinophagaceae bacterium]
MKKNHPCLSLGMFKATCLSMLSLTLMVGCKKAVVNTTNESNAANTTMLASVVNPSYSFLRGADVGFLTEMEKKGNVFYNTTDQQDLFTVLKERNINAIRLRVWVNPAGPNYYNGISDVVAKAVRAKNAGMKVMIDFHYSDSWADPNQQTKPAAWTSYSLTALASAVATHTTACLDSLQAYGVTPDMVQVGNETDYGMLWPTGKLPDSMANYATLYKAGYNAVKAFNSNIKVIVHFSRGYDNTNCSYVLNGLLANGASFDVAAISVYPTSNYNTVMSNTLTNMLALESTYSKPVLVAECGYFQSDPRTTRKMIETLISYADSIPNNNGLGVYYWEPEAYNHAAPNRSAFDATNKNPNVGMDGFSYLSNPGFEVDTVGVTSATGWLTGGSNPDANYTEISSHTGSFRLTHFKTTAYNVSTYQTITGLTNGLYTFQAWVKAPQTMVSNYLFAKDFGGTQVNVDIPLTSPWKKLQITNINVTNGTCTIGFQTAGNNTYTSFDDVEFFKQ